MVQFMRVLALDARQQAYPVTALTIDPGVMDTAMQAQIREADPTDFPDHPRFVARHAAGELRPPAVVADFVFRVVCAGHPGGSYDIDDDL